MATMPHSRNKKSLIERFRQFQDSCLLLVLGWTNVSIRVVRAAGFGALILAGIACVQVREYALALVPWVIFSLSVMAIFWPPAGTKVGALKPLAYFFGSVTLLILGAWTVAAKGADPWTNFARLLSRDKVPVNVGPMSAQEQKPKLNDTPLFVKAQSSVSGYPPGTNIAGIKWKDGYADLRVTLSNQTDYDFKNMDLTIASDLFVIDIKQLEPVCQGFNVFSGAASVSIDLKDESGKIVHGEPTGESLTNQKRAVCSNFPHHSTTDLVIPLVSFGNGAEALPKKMDYRKRLPKWCSVTGTYQVEAESRNINFRSLCN